MQELTPRQAEIMALARQSAASTSRARGAFAVTPQTIRKDLNELCDRRALSRQHGRATYPSGVANYAYEARRLLAAEASAASGLRAARSFSTIPR